MHTYSIHTLINRAWIPIITWRSFKAPGIITDPYRGVRIIAIEIVIHIILWRGWCVNDIEGIPVTITILVGPPKRIIAKGKKTEPALPVMKCEGTDERIINNHSLYGEQDGRSVGARKQHTFRDRFDIEDGTRIRRCPIVVDSNTLAINMERAQYPHYQYHTPTHPLDSAVVPALKTGTSKWLHK